MNEPLRPSDEQMHAWLRHLEYWSMDWDEKEVHSDLTGYYGDTEDNFPAYYNEEHDRYLRGLISEVLEYRAFKRGEWTGTEDE